MTDGGILDILSLTQGGFAGTSDTPYDPISYPLEIPSTPGFRRFAMKQERAQRNSMSPATFSTQIQASAGERWVAEASLPLMTRATAGPWQGLFNMLDGKANTFMLGDSLGRQPRGTPLGIPKVRESNQTGKQLIVYNCVANIEGWLKAGDYFQLGNRLYQVSRDASTDGFGSIILDFWPRLREVYAVDTPLITENCKGEFRMLDVSWESWSADESQLYSISFTAEEAL